MIKNQSYKNSGVNVDAGAEFVDAIRPHVRSTIRPGANVEIGGFGALFDLAATGYSDPILVASTDGVGTKLKVALAAGRHDTVGIDLVAMCVNDLVVQGAEPLFFLDYFATGRLVPADAERVVSGIATGCRDAGCALIGGETAEMPGMYTDDDYDLAGFSVGAVERNGILDGQKIEPGDSVLGISSSGLHSNGFSLVRKIIDDLGLDINSPAPFADGLLGDALLTPTKIYVRSCLAAYKANVIKGLAHITGGGLIDNIPRVLPSNLGVRLDSNSWPIPKVFKWLQAAGQVEIKEMFRIFNCGIGMVVITAPENEDAATAILSDTGETVFRIGTTEFLRGENAEPVVIEGAEMPWND